MQSFLLIGSNMGDREAHLKSAGSMIQDLAGKLVSASPVIESEPWGFACKEWFLNQVLCITTTLSPASLLHTTQGIEKQMGREQKKTGGYQSRIIDIDILYYGDVQLSTPELTLPHPHIADRLFTLTLLTNIAADYIHPVLKKSHKELLALCQDASVLKPL